MSNNYYKDKLNSQGLFKAYNTDIARVRQYLNAEIEFVKKRLCDTDMVLELGAGYGRIVLELADECNKILGVDISDNSVHLGNELLSDKENASLVQMDVHKLDLENEFDVILCLQNGLSAMKLSTTSSIKQIMTFLKKGGKAYFSTYSDKFWDHRVAWFKEQADKGLLGELDMDKTKDGVIVCKDGFKAVTHSKEDLKRIAEDLGMKYTIEEVDQSSLFLIIEK